MYTVVCTRDPHSDVRKEQAGQACKAPCNIPEGAGESHTERRKPRKDTRYPLHGGPKDGTSGLIYATGTSSRHGEQTRGRVGDKREPRRSDHEPPTVTNGKEGCEHRGPARGPAPRPAATQQPSTGRGSSGGAVRTSPTGIQEASGLTPGPAQQVKDLVLS